MNFVSAMQASLACSLKVNFPHSMKPSKWAEWWTTLLGPQATACSSYKPAQPPPAPLHDMHLKALRCLTVLSCSGSLKGGRVKAESWGMLLLVSAWPKDTPKIPWYKGMPSLQIHSFHPALSLWNCIEAGSERALQNFGGQEHCRSLIIIKLSAVQTTKLQVFLPSQLFSAEITLETEWNIQRSYGGGAGNIYPCEAAWSVP